MQIVGVVQVMVRFVQSAVVVLMFAVVAAAGLVVVLYS